METFIKNTDLNSLKQELVQVFRKVIREENSNNVNKDWLTEKEAREYLSVCKSTLQTYRRDGVIPFSQYKGKIRFLKTDLDEHLFNNYSKRRI